MGSLGKSIDFNREGKTTLGGGPKTANLQYETWRLKETNFGDLETNFSQASPAANTILVLRTLIWDESTTACLTILTL